MIRDKIMWYKSRKQYWYKLSYYRHLYIGARNPGYRRDLEILGLTTMEQELPDVIESAYDTDYDDEFWLEFLDILISKIVEREKKCTFDDILNIITVNKKVEQQKVIYSMRNGKPLSFN